MNNKIFKYSLFSLLILLSSSLFASSLRYFEQSTNSTGKQARERHAELKTASLALSFLDCPIEMIERQWGGTKSVNSGLKYLQSYFNENMSVLEYQKLHQNCYFELEQYRQNANQGGIKSRPLTPEEIESLSLLPLQSKTGVDRELILTVLAAVNSDTLCYANRTSMELGYLIGGSIGYMDVACFTPLGRRFALRGPSLGYGAGFIAAATLPYAGANNSKSWKLQLYAQQGEIRTWHEDHVIVENAFLGGLSCNFKNGLKKKYTIPQCVLSDKMPALGTGIMLQHNHNFLKIYNLNPLYINLNKIIDLKIIKHRILGY